MQAVFGIGSKIDPIAGSTEFALSYPLNKSGSASIINYPGFNDYRAAIDKHTDDYLHQTDVFVMVVDINRGISGTEKKILEKVEAFKRPILICLNKVDLVRTKMDLEKLKVVARERLPGHLIVETAFDPDLRLCDGAIGVKEVYHWIREEVRKDGKNVDVDNFPPLRET